MGGQRIDDHSFWAGKGSNGSVFPMGAKVKAVPGVDGAGELKKYCDSPEAIKKYQDESVSKIKRETQKDGYRN